MIIGLSRYKDIQHKPRYYVRELRNQAASHPLVSYPAEFLLSVHGTIFNMPGPNQTEVARLVIKQLLKEEAENE